MQMIADLQHVARAGIRDGNNARLRRQGLQPVGQSILRVLPVLWCGLQPLIDHAPVFLLRDDLAKRIFALHRPAFATGGGQAVKGKAVYAFFF
ncbi:hypothetical protein D3C72_1415270 [compost metagenome]